MGGEPPRPLPLLRQGVVPSKRILLITDSEYYPFSTGDSDAGHGGAGPGHQGTAGTTPGASLPAWVGGARRRGGGALPRPAAGRTIAGAKPPPARNAAGNFSTPKRLRPAAVPAAGDRGTKAPPTRGGALVAGGWVFYCWGPPFKGWSPAIEYYLLPTRNITHFRPAIL